MLHFVRPVKRSVSCKKAARLLKIKLTEFQELCVLFGVKPYEFRNKHKDDFEDKLHYKIEDVQKILDSEAYLTIHGRNKMRRRRETYIEECRVSRLERTREVEFRFLEIIKQRYESFRDAVIDLGQSLNILFMVRNVFIGEVACSKELSTCNNKRCAKRDLNAGDSEQNACDKDLKDLNAADSGQNECDKDCTAHKDEQNASSKNNIASCNECEELKIIKKYKDLVEENELKKLQKEIKKYEKEIYEILADFKNFMIETKGIKKCFLMNKGYNFLGAIENIEICWTEPFQVANDIKFEDFDISEIKYSFKYSFYHLKSVLYKLRKEELKINKFCSNIFENYTFYIENRNENLEYIIKSGCGIIKNECLTRVCRKGVSVCRKEECSKEVCLKGECCEGECCEGMCLKGENLQGECVCRKGECLKGVCRKGECLKEECRKEEGVSCKHNPCSSSNGCNSDESVDFYITEKNIKDFNINTKYVYPQFIFDSFNANNLLDYKNYITGKKIPEHFYPFNKNEEAKINFNDLILLSKTKKRKINEILKEAKDKKF